MRASQIRRRSRVRRATTSELALDVPPSRAPQVTAVAALPRGAIAVLRVCGIRRCRLRLGEVADVARTSDARRRVPSRNRRHAHIGREGRRRSCIVVGVSPPAPLQNETLAPCGFFYRRLGPNTAELEATLDQGFPGYFGSPGLQIYKVYIYI
jgi:hypothetical protein